MDLELIEIKKKKEIWRDIVGYEGYYQVSSKGRVRRIKRTVIKNGHPCVLSRRNLSLKNKSDGYIRVSLQKNSKSKTCLVHRLVAIAFLSNPFNKPQVNHKNTIRSDNTVDNLEWSTSSENIQHKFDSGYKQDKGLKDSQSRLVRQFDLNGNLIKEYGSIREAERISKVFRAAISKCNKGMYRQAGGYVWKIQSN